MAMRESQFEKACSTCGGPLFACEGKHTEAERRAAEEERSPQPGLHSRKSFIDMDLPTSEAPAYTAAIRVRNQIMRHVGRLEISDSPLGRALDRNLNMGDFGGAVRRTAALEPTIQRYLEGKPTEVDLERVLKALIDARVNEEQQEKISERRAA